MRHLGMISREIGFDHAGIMLRGEMADGLSTTLFVLGRESGTAFQSAHCPEATAYWVMRRP